MNSPLYTWARKHGVTWQAIEELRTIFGTDVPVASALQDLSEAAVQSRVMLEAPKHGFRLFRNNVGALIDSRGVPVRYGLANTSPELNKRLKSSDLIGWKATLVTPCMVGSYVAIFTALEVKEAVWTYKGDAHEKAQEAWLKLVAADGGIARFINNEADLP
jgi:hypothetical protein